DGGDRTTARTEQGNARSRKACRDTSRSKTERNPRNTKSGCWCAEQCVITNCGSPEDGYRNAEQHAVWNYGSTEGGYWNAERCVVGKCRSAKNGYRSAEQCIIG